MRPAKVSGRFWLNLVALGCVCLIFSAWAGYYSNWLPTIELLFGGGGVVFLATLVVSSLIPPAGREQIKSWAELFVSSSAFTITLIAVSASVLLLANFLGSVQVESLAEEPVRSVSVAPTTGGGATTWLKLVPVEPVRCPVWTAWFRPRSMVVSVLGFPPRTVAVRPFRRTLVTVPTDVPAINLLLRPTPFLRDLVRQAPLIVRIIATDAKGHDIKVESKFTGEPLLVGNYKDALIPPDLARTSMSPSTGNVEFVPIDVLVGETVQILLVQKKTGNKYESYGPTTSAIAKVGVQEVILRAPSENPLSK